MCGNPISAERNNGVTMLNLFRDWPRERLAQVNIESATAIPPVGSVCCNCWKLTPGSVLIGRLGISSSGRCNVGGSLDLLSVHKSLPRLRRAFPDIARWKHRAHNCRARSRSDHGLEIAGDVSTWKLVA